MAATNAPERRGGRYVSKGGGVVPAQHTQPSFIDPDDNLYEAEDGFRIDGLLVVDTTRPQNLPSAPYNHLKLTLEDGSTRYQCVDCPEVIGNHTDIRKHRQLVHPSKRLDEKMPESLRQMTLGQLVSIAESSTAYGAMLERAEQDRDRYRQELAEITRKYTQLTRALDRAGFMPKLEEEE